NTAPETCQRLNPLRRVFVTSTKIERNLKQLFAPPRNTQHAFDVAYIKEFVTSLMAIVGCLKHFDCSAMAKNVFILLKFGLADITRSFVHIQFTTRALPLPDINTYEKYNSVNDFRNETESASTRNDHCK
uniref:Uncharacterized protein n=1 Tax=Glossina palpalis gambiensis TaxID=67801 RepID=A0A1B0ANN6_9MUSC